MDIKKIYSYGFGPLVAGVLTVLTLPILTWYFSEEDIGRFTLLQILVSLSVMIFSLSLHQAYVREYNEVINKKELLLVSIFPGLLLLILAIFLLILYLFLSPQYFLSSILFDVESNIIVFLIILSIILSFFINIFNHVIRMEEKVFSYSIMQITPKLIFILMLVFVIFFGRDKNFVSLNIAFTFSIFITFVMVMYLTRESWNGLLSTNFNMKLMRETLYFSFPLMFGGIAYWGVFTVDRIFLKIYSGLTSVAIYAVATTVASCVTLLSSIFTTIWHPMVYKWAKDGLDNNKIQELINIITITVFLIWSLIGSFSWVIPYFLPNEYYEVEYLVVACASGPLLYLLSELTVIGIGLARKSKYSLYASFLAFLGCILMNITLIPLYGANGAAITMVLTFSLLLVLRTEFSVKLYCDFLSRGRIYVTMVLYVFFTIFFILKQPGVILYVFFWIILMLIVLMLFKKEFFKIILYINKRGMG